MEIKIPETTIQDTKPNKVNLLLDSGAFSAWAQSARVNLDEYIKFIKENIDIIHAYVNLDVIPGQMWRTPTSKEVEISAQKGWDNLIYMENQGLKPIPVFHQGERLYWLDKLLKHGCDWIGISPANDRSTLEKMEWLDKVFDFITTDDGIPIIKTHAFGVTATHLLFRYPWYSVDSTSWTTISRYGKVLVPKSFNNKYDYKESPYVISVSDREEKQQDISEHYLTVSQSTRNKLDKYFELKNTSFNELTKGWHPRDILNIQYYLDLEAAINNDPSTKKFDKSLVRKEFFDVENIDNYNLPIYDPIISIAPIKPIEIDMKDYYNIPITIDEPTKKVGFFEANDTIHFDIAPKKKGFFV